MKIMVGSVVLFVLISSGVYADLTEGDLDKIRDIVRESEERLNVRINDVDQSLNRRMDDMEGSLNRRMDDMEGSLNRRIDDLKAELKGDIGEVRWMVAIMFGILGAVIAAAIAVPQVVGRKKVEELQERIIRLEAKLEGSV